ncbi:MAG: hypothetical protein ACLRR6_02035 [Oscillospiraceae bacterium]
MVDLRSCPFCGGNEIIIRPVYYAGSSIHAFTHSAEDVSHRLRQSGQRSWAQSKTGIGEPTMVKNLNHETASVCACNHKNRIKTHFAKIIVSGTSKKPCYDILYFDPTDRKYHIGFGSYCLDYVFKWLAEEFEIEEAAPTADFDCEGSRLAEYTAPEVFLLSKKSVSQGQLQGGAKCRCTSMLNRQRAISQVCRKKLPHDARRLYDARQLAFERRTGVEIRLFTACVMGRDTDRRLCGLCQAGSSAELFLLSQKPASQRQLQGGIMFGRRKLKAEIVRLSYRVSELEERLCPCESHSWVMLDSDFTIGSSAGDIDTIYRYKCRRCGKTLKTYKLLPTERLHRQIENCRRGQLPLRQFSLSGRTHS